MPIIKIKKSERFTILSNDILRDKDLSLKAIGLLCKMLSLPPDWDFSLNGLLTMCKEKEASVNAGLQELEKAGYLTRTKIRDEKGRIKDVEYCVYEEKQIISRVDPKVENQEMDNPKMDNPTQQKKEDINNLNISISSTNNLPEEKTTKNDANAFLSFSQAEELVKNNIEYYTLYQDISNQSYLDAIIYAMVEVIQTRSKTIAIGKKVLKTEDVRKIFMLIHTGHILSLLDRLKTSQKPITTMGSYIKTCLYNAYGYNDAEIQHQTQE